MSFTSLPRLYFQRTISVILFICFHFWCVKISASTIPQPIALDHSEASIGTFFIFKRNTWAFLIDTRVGFTLNTTPFCKNHHCQLLDLKLRFTAANTPFERYVPYLEMQLTTFRFQLKSWLFFGFGSLHYFRSPKRMDTEAKLSVSLTQVGIRLMGKRPWGQIYFTIAGQTLGYTNWQSFGFSIPFHGLYLIGLNPTINVRFGNQKIGLDLLASGLSALSVGTSGNHYAPDIPGGFESLFSESWFEFGVRFSIKLPLPSITWFVQANARYHILFNSGNQTLLTGTFVGCTTGVAFQ